MAKQTLRDRILELVASYSNQTLQATSFRPGIDPVPVSGKVLDGNDMTLLVDACLDGWLTTGRFNSRFEKAFASFTGSKHALTTNSGSSANLLALSSLTSPLLGDRALKPGDEVITVAAAFPTTINPILQHGLIPVFVDVSLPEYNIDVSLLENAIGQKTRAIMLAHTLGNPYDLDTISRLCQKHDLWLIEDCCDALGSIYGDRHVGNFGDIATCSFYPAHHITMGEGGAVFTNNAKLKRAALSIRDWGRDCHCEPGHDDTCGKRFGWQLGSLPAGYDHKYIYSHLGYNLKITDMQAAIGLAQIQKLNTFIERRKHNFARLNEGLGDLSERLILPRATPGSDPAWFGFPITMRDPDDSREALTAFLERHRIATRLLFAGNITRQPYFEHREYRVASTLKNTDRIMHSTFWIGVWPGLSDDMIDYVIDRFHDYSSGMT